MTATSENSTPVENSGDNAVTFATHRELGEILAMMEARDYPDVADGTCCYGSAVFGYQYCTCWECVYDQGQQEPKLGMEPEWADRMCADCAFRPGSPERTDSPHAVAGSGDLLRIVADPQMSFWCHRGLRRVVAERHPCGVEIPRPPQAGVVAYRPPIVDGVPYQIDGTPGLRCAGVAAARRCEDWLP